MLKKTWCLFSDTTPRALSDKTPRETVCDKPPRETVCDKTPRETVCDKTPQETVRDKPPRALLLLLTLLLVADGGGSQETVRDKTPQALGDKTPRETVGDKTPQKTVRDKTPRALGDKPPQETVYDKPPRALSDKTPRALDEWQLRKEADGISVYSRQIQDVDYLEFKAVTKIPGKVASALALLNDTAACSQWLHRCVESHVITQISNLESIFYQVSKLPFPAKARDLVFHAVASQKPTGEILVTLRARPDLLPLAEPIRIRHAYGTYLLEPLSDTTSRLTWQQYIDPAGSLPAWIVNRMLVDLPFNSLQAFRKLVTHQPYRDTKIGYDEKGMPNALIPAKAQDDSSSNR